LTLSSAISALFSAFAERCSFRHSLRSLLPLQSAAAFITAPSKLALFFAFAEHCSLHHSLRRLDGQRALAAAGPFLWQTHRGPGHLLVGFEGLN
jgi:hypothetical protein